MNRGEMFMSVLAFALCSLFGFAMYEIVTGPNDGQTREDRARRACADACQSTGAYMKAFSWHREICECAK